MMGRFSAATERVEKWLSPIYWTDINIQSALYEDVIPVPNIYVYVPSDLERPPIHKLLGPENRETVTFVTTQIGSSFGPSWSTAWFKVTIPPLQPLPLHRQYALRFDSNSEAMIYSSSGVCLQAFTGGNGHDRRDLYFLTTSDDRTELTFYIEMACNEMFGNGNGGMIKPPNPNRYFVLSALEIVVVNTVANELYRDVLTLYDLAKGLGEADPVAENALTIANTIINNVDLQDDISIMAASSMANVLLRVSNPQLTAKVDHDVFAVGHCHIDTAWLWPYAETRRKVVRSWSTQLGLLNKYPDWQFVASQAVQVEWVRQDQPELYDRILKAVRIKFIVIFCAIL